MPDIIGKKMMNRLSILASCMIEKQFLGIQILGNSASKAKAQATHNALQAWQVENLFRTTCFDMTTSNIGSSTGNSTIFEKLSGKHLQHFASGHYTSYS